MSLAFSEKNANAYHSHSSRKKAEQEKRPGRTRFLPGASEMGDIAGRPMAVEEPQVLAAYENDREER